MGKKSFALYLKQLTKDFEQKFEFNQVPEVLEERANYLLSILLKFKDSKLELGQKHNVPFPGAFSELDEKKLIVTFKELLATGNPPYHEDDLIYQLYALFLFYNLFTELKILPPPYLLLKVDNLAMQTLYFAGARISSEPFLASEFVRIHSIKTKTGKKKEIRGEIIIKAAEEKKIPFGKTSRSQQTWIKKEIKRPFGEEK